MLPYDECPNVFSCVFWDSWQFIDWRAITLAACFWIGAMLVAYARGKTRHIRRLWLDALRGSVVTLAAIGLFLIGIILFYSPWQRYGALREYAKKTVEDKDKTISTQQTTIKDLEAKLREQSKVVYRDSKIPSKSAEPMKIASLLAEATRVALLERSKAQDAFCCIHFNEWFCLLFFWFSTYRFCLFRKNIDCF